MIARIKGYGIRPVKGKNEPLLVVQFETADGKTYYWQGSFSGGAREHSMKACLVMGFAGEYEDLGMAAGGIQSGTFNHLQDYDVILKDEVYEGKTTTKVQWINLPGTGHVKDAIDVDAAKNMFAAMNAKGDFLALKKSLSSGVPAPASSEDVPF